MPLSGDAFCFVPVAGSLKKSGEWSNPLYGPLVPADTAHPKRFIWHGIVAPAVWAAMSGGADFSSLRTGGVLVSALGVLCFCLAVRRRIQNFQTKDVLVLLLAGLAVTVFFTHNGRPESVAASITALGLLVMPVRVSTSWSAGIGFFLGLLAATAPTSALLLSPLIVVYLVLQSGSALCLLRYLVVIALIVPVVMFGLVWLSGCPPLLWLEAMRLHSGAVLWGRTDTFLYPYWVADPSFPLACVTVVGLAACVVVSMSHQVLAMWRKVGAAVVICMFLCLAWLLAVRPSPCRYNLIPCLVVLMFSAVCLTARCAEHGRRRMLMYCLLLPSLCLPALGFARSVAVYALAKPKALNFGTAAAGLIEDLKKHSLTNCNILVHSSLFELMEVLENNHLSVFVGFPAGDDVLIVPQANSGLVEPREIPGYQFLTDSFIREASYLSGVKIASNFGGYSYAIYSRAECAKADRNTVDSR